MKAALVSATRAIHSVVAAAPDARSGAAGDALALICGALTVFAFAPFGFYPLAILTLMGLFWLVTGVSARRAFWRGFLFGVAEFAFGLYWLYISIHSVSGAPVWLTLLVIAAVVAIMAVYGGLACGLGVWIMPRAGMLRQVVLLPALWVLLEWARGWVLSGFPWLSLGYSQIDGLLRGYAPLLGVYGVSLAAALSAGLLLGLLTSGGRWHARIGCFIGLILLWAVGGILAAVPWTHPSGTPIKVSLVQGNIPQSLKWDPQEFLPTLERYRKLTEAHWDSRLIIWPEAAIPAYADEVQRDYLDPLEAAARKHGTDFLIGVPTEDAAGHYYNSVISLGSRDGVYNKRHLVPMAEYFPAPAWVTSWLESMDLPYSSFTPGDARQPLLQVAGYPVGVSICYEDAFGNEIMRALPRAAFLVNVTNDAWFGDSIALPQHFQISRMRALEAGRYLLRSTNTGITAVVNPAGGVAAEFPIDTAGVLTAEVRPYAGRSPYVLWGNWAVVILAGIGGVAAWLLKDK